MIRLSQRFHIMLCVLFYMFTCFYEYTTILSTMQHVTGRKALSCSVNLNRLKCPIMTCITSLALQKVGKRTTEKMSLQTIAENSQGRCRRKTTRAKNLIVCSGAGTNLKVGGTGPEQKWGGHRCGAKRRENCLGRSPPLFGSKSTISRFCERFPDGQYSLVSFLFAVLLLTVPPCPVIVKVGGTCPPCPMKSAPLIVCRCLRSTPTLSLVIDYLDYQLYSMNETQQFINVMYTLIYWQSRN